MSESNKKEADAIHLPQTNSIVVLAAFWDEHDVTDFEVELEEVSEPVFEKSKN